MTVQSRAVRRCDVGVRVSIGYTGHTVLSTMLPPSSSVCTVRIGARAMRSGVCVSNSRDRKGRAEQRITPTIVRGSRPSRLGSSGYPERRVWVARSVRGWMGHADRIGRCHHHFLETKRAAWTSDVVAAWYRREWDERPLYLLAAAHWTTLIPCLSNTGRVIAAVCTPSWL